MSRIEEALRRAGRNLPDSPVVMDDQALDEARPTDPVPQVESFASEVEPTLVGAAAMASVTPPGLAASASPAPGIEMTARTSEAPRAPAVRTEPATETAIAPEPDATPAEDREPVFETGDPGLDGKIVLSRAISQSSVEQYRRLAATLHHEQVERGIKVVMVASALSGEGKTLTTVNLALTLSHSYARRVLLIDADLRRPTVHQIFDVPNTNGLNQGLRADTLQKLSLVQVSPRLAVLPAGKPDPDPMSALTSGRMRRVLTEAAEAFDWVILDTPPVTVLTDANLLAGMVDAAVLVVAAGRTPHPSVQRAIANVGRDRILGVVLNRVEETVLGRQIYYDSYYYAANQQPETGLRRRSEATL